MTIKRGMVRKLNQVQIIRIYLNGIKNYEGIRLGEQEVLGMLYNPVTRVHGLKKRHKYLLKSRDYVMRNTHANYTYENELFAYLVNTSSYSGEISNLPAKDLTP